MMGKKWQKAFLLFSAAAALTVAAAAAGITYPDTFTNPVANGADPFVFKDDDGIYYLYTTSGDSYGYRVYTSENLVDWKCQSYCLRREDVYYADRSAYAGFWAPEIIKDGDTYYMVYTAQEHLGIAVSDSPLGPFTNTETSYLLNDFKNIDGHFFRDDDGKLYLYFVGCYEFTYNGYTNPSQNCIWGGEFSLETRDFVSKPQLLLTWEDEPASLRSWRVVEGPEMLKHNGKYYLTYSSSGYSNPGYSVNYATSDSPLGPFKKSPNNPILISDDVSRTDTENPHLYGTAHHCFTTSPDGTELIIVYHAHRSGTAPNEQAGYVQERRVCIDKAYFDTKGNLCVDGPTATEQSAPSGAKLGRTVELDENFAALANLPVVYVAATDGLDTNPGTKEKPFQTLNAAYAALPSGGTIVLTQAYNMSSKYVTDSAYYCSPAVNGPVMIRGLFSSVPVEFKFWSLSSDTYIDNLALFPSTTGTVASGISVIECGQNNVILGEGVSCCSRNNSEQFPVLVGGHWRYNANASTSPYKYYDTEVKTEAMLTTDKSYTLKVLGGTWSIVTELSMKNTSVVQNSAPNASLVLGGGSIIRPAKATGFKAVCTADGALLTCDAVQYAKKYAFYKVEGAKTTLLGYSDTPSFTDTSYKPGEKVNYKAAGYIHGACIGDPSNTVSLTSYGDMDGSETLRMKDALLLLHDVQNSTPSQEKSDNVLRILKYIAK